MYIKSFISFYLNYKRPFQYPYIDIRIFNIRIIGLSYFLLQDSYEATLKF